MENYNIHHIDRFRGLYWFLSNFYICTIVYNGYRYSSVEAAFQAQKDPSIQHEFCDLSPKEARHKGQRVNLRPDWENVKYNIMKDVLRIKFSIPELRNKLLATGTTYIEEGNNFGDRDWGTVNGIGQNNLGKLLMQIRDELRNN